MFACDVCNKSFKEKYYLNRHRERIHLENKYACNFCFKEFKTKHDMSKHVYNLHNNTVQNCSFCDAKFKTYSRLSYHVKVLHKSVKDPENRICIECKYTAPSTSALKLHFERTHLGIKV